MVLLIGLLLTTTFPGWGFAAQPEMPPGEKPGLFQEMLEDGRLDGVEEVVFAERGGTGWHWYETFGYVCQNPDHKKFPSGGGKLLALNLRTGGVRTILEDSSAAIRDPVVHWDGDKILFSYLKGPAPNYLLYEINTDGTGLRQVTEGQFDDIEPVYLPDGGIMMGSGRAKRYVPCFNTPVATLHRREPDGTVRMVSSNVEHDNTPWVMNDGRVLYTRWEYVMRGVLAYHHLWTMNPDGTTQMVYFGNHFGGTLMIDAKHIPGSDKIIAVFSPWHGGPEHNGGIGILDPAFGTDEKEAAVRILNPQNLDWEADQGGEWAKAFKERGYHSQGEWRDPYAISEDCFFVALRGNLCVIDGEGNYEVIYTLPGMDPTDRKMHLHEPRPLIARERPPTIPNRVDPTTDQATFFLQDVYVGRQMQDVERGAVKKIVIAEDLANPVSFQATSEPQIGQHNIQRVIGEVPVEEDGSAYFKAPAVRSLVFLAVDENDRTIKPMRSFVTAMQGEVSSCVGCHENRTIAPVDNQTLTALALQRAPSQPADILDVPHDIIDFQRDLQPILERHCVECHDASGEQEVVLSGDAGLATSLAYQHLRSRWLVDLGGSRGQVPAYEGPSMASKVVDYFTGEHHKARATPEELRLIKLWLDTGACYAGSYAAVGSGVLGGRIEMDIPTPEPLMEREIAFMAKNCSECHAPKKTRDQFKQWRKLERAGFPLRVMDDPLVNLTRPELSRVLRAPLSKNAGGLGLCNQTEVDAAAAPSPIESRNDATYKELLSILEAFKSLLHDNGSRYYMDDFVPNEHYVREMKRYGILPESFDRFTDDTDWFEVENRYYQSFWPLATAETPENPLPKNKTSEYYE